MTTMPRPARTDAAALSSLREGLDALAALDPDYDVAAGLHRFDALCRTSPAVSRHGMSRAKLVLLSTALVTMAAVATRWVATTEAPDAAQPSVDAIAAAPMPEVASAPAVDLPTANSPANDVRPPATPTQRVAPSPPNSAAAPAVLHKRSPRAKAVPAVKPAAPSAGDDTLLREMQLLNGTRRHVVAKQPEQALELIATARATLASRQFDEEWDALEILALAAALRLDEAERRAEVFLTHHRNGRFEASIERALADARARADP